MTNQHLILEMNVWLRLVLFLSGPWDWYRLSNCMALASFLKALNPRWAALVAHLGLSPLELEHGTHLCSRHCAPYHCSNACVEPLVERTSGKKLQADLFM